MMAGKGVGWLLGPACRSTPMHIKHLECQCLLQALVINVLDKSNKKKNPLRRSHK